MNSRSSKRRSKGASHHKKEKGEDEDIDYSQLARMELLKLQRQYRLMQSTQHDFAEESGTTISRQHRIMKFLGAERENLEVDYHNADSVKNRIEDEMHREYITLLVEKYEDYQLKIKGCLTTIEEMEDQVDKITHRVVQQNLKIQSLFGMSLTPAEASKRLRTLENRLYQMTTRYDTLVSENVYLRSVINTILMERGRYHKRTLFMKKCIANLKKRMMEIVDIATLTYEARDEHANKIRALRERDDKESRQHSLELKEWQRVLHDDEKQHSFMSTKMQDRSVIERDNDRENRHKYELEALLDYILMKYKRSFKEILALGVPVEVEALCHDYMEKDQTNFTHFKYISDINSEIEVIRDTINAIKEDIQNIAKESGESRVQHIESLAHQKRELVLTRLKLAERDTDLHHGTGDIDQCIAELEHMFNSLHCSNESIVRLLGNSVGMNPFNANLCITVIERTVTQLILDKHALTIRKAVELEGRQLPNKQPGPGFTGGGDKPKGGGGPYKPKVILSGRNDAAADEDDAEDEKWLSSGRLSYDELKENVLEKMKLAASVGLDTSTSSESVSFPSAIPSTMSLLQLNKESHVTMHPGPDHHHHHDHHHHDHEHNRRQSTSVALRRKSLALALLPTTATAADNLKSTASNLHTIDDPPRQQSMDTGHRGPSQQPSPDHSQSHK